MSPAQGRCFEQAGTTAAAALPLCKYDTTLPRDRVRVTQRIVITVYGLACCFSSYKYHGLQERNFAAPHFIFCNYVHTYMHTGRGRWTKLLLLLHVPTAVGLFAACTRTLAVGVWSHSLRGATASSDYSSVEEIKRKSGERKTLRSFFPPSTTHGRCCSTTYMLLFLLCTTTAVQSTL